MEPSKRRGLEVVLGVILALVMVTAVAAIWESFRGKFSDKITVKAELAQAGDALEIGDIVTYKDVIVGEVATAAGNLSGGAVATLKIDPKKAAVIPASVSAVALPASLFGLTRIELVPSSRGTGGPTLTNNSVIRPDQSPAAESLQTALSNAYTLLTSVHPAELDAALSSLATALDGQGRNLGDLVVKADAYLRALAPMLPGIDATVRSLADVTDEIARNAPELVATLGSSLTVAKGILADKQALAALLSAAPKAIDDAQALMSTTNVEHAVTIFTNEVPVLQAFGARPDALPQTLDGLKQFAKTFAEISSSGPYLKIDLLLTGVNFGQLLQVEAGGQGHAFDAISDPPLYTSADCPRYVGASGPNCVSATANGKSVAQMLSTGTSFGGNVGSVGSPAEISVIERAAALMSGLPANSASANLADLLLGPLLRGLPAVLR